MSESVLDLERAYLIDQLGLTEDEGAVFSIQDLRNQFYLSPPAGGANASESARGMHSEIAGRWHGPSGTNSNVSPLNNTVFFLPAFFHGPCTITDLGIWVTTAVASSVIRVGLFTFDPATETFTLLEDFGTFDCSTTGTKILTGLSFDLDTSLNLFWGYAVSGGASSPTVKGTDFGHWPFPQYYGSATNNPGQENAKGLRVNYAGGPFGASYVPNAAAYNGQPNLSYKFV